MTKNDKDTLQSLCRSYLSRLRYMAAKHGLARFVDDTIAANRRGACEATRHEVDILARCVDEERIRRSEIPALIGQSYRQCIEDGDFDAVSRLPDQGTYSRVSAMLLKDRKRRKSVKEG